MIEENYVKWFYEQPRNLGKKRKKGLQTLGLGEGRRGRGYGFQMWLSHHKMTTPEKLLN